MVASNRRLCSVIAFVFAVAFPTLASAATADFRVLFDVDNNAATGCTDGGITGIEQILVTRIVTTDTSAQVTRMYRQGCSAGVFGAPADLDLTARPAGFSSPSGLVFAEARIAYSALTNAETLPLGMRLYFDASDGFSAQGVEEMPNGDSILYPPTDIPKRHSVGTRGTPRTIVLDGQVGDWNGINPLVVGVAANGSTAVRILKIYAYANPVDHFLYLRFDGFLNNSNPYAQDDTYSRKIGEGLNVAAPGVLGNDGDPSGKPLTAMPVSPAEHGNVTLNPDGSFTYAPDDPTSFTSDKFDYKANNGTKDSNVARVTINVSINPSQAPTAVDDNYQTSEDTTLDVSAPGVLGNDIDPDGPTLSSTLLTDASHGKVTLASNGAFTYIPAANYSGTDTFTYRVSDGTNSDDAIVTITIGAINDAPKTSNLTVTTAEDTPVGITLSATDTEGGTLTYNVGSPTNGSLSGTAPNLTYTPFPNYFGPDSFTYTVTDSGGKTSTPASVVNITVTPVNDPPSFTSGGNVSSNEDTPYSAAWASNVSTGPANEGQTATFNITNNTSPGLFASGPSIIVSGTTGTLSYTPALNANGSADITVTLSDGVATTAPVMFTITIIPINDPPTVNAAPSLAYTEGNGAVVIDNTVTVTDPDSNITTATVQITASYVNGEDILAFVNNFGITGAFNPLNGTLTLTGPASPANFQSALRTVTYQNTSAAPSTAPRTLTWTVNDAQPSSGTDTSTITITAINTAPTLTVTGAVTHTEGGAATNLATAANIVDPDDTNIESATIQITSNFAAGQDVLSFVNTANITGSFVGNTLTLTGSDTKANYIAALQAVQYTNTSDTPSTLQRSITWTVNDGTDNSNTQITTLDVTATNDAPVNTLPAPQSTDEDTPLTLTGATKISISDVDADPDDVQVTLNVTNGTVTVNPIGVGALTSLTGNGTNMVVATGTVAEINAVLDGLVFNPTADYFGAASIQVITDDLGNNPSGNQTDTDTLNITVNAINDAPVLSVTGAVTHTEGGAATNLATAANITDVDDTNIESATIRISVNFVGGEDVLSFVNFGNISGSFVGDTLTLTGSDTKANYITALQSVQYTNTSDTPSTQQRTITWKVNDGDVDSNTQTTTLDVTATNDAPVNNVPGAQATPEDTPRTFGVVNSNLISISDPDANPDDVQVTLNVTNGTVALDPSDTGALTTLTGNGTNMVVATGTIAEINAALDGLVFSPTANYFGAASIQIVTDDLGNNPSGNQTDSDTVNITVNTVNDAPVNTVPGTQTFNEDTTLTFSTGNGNAVSVADVDLGGGNIQVALSTTAGTLTLSGTTGLSFSFSDADGTGTGDGTADASMTFRGTLTDVNNALQGMTFTPTLDIDGAQTISMTSNDLGNSGSGGSLTDSDTINLSITAINDAPINSVAGAQNTTEDTPLTFSSGNGNVISISDPDAGANIVQVQLSVTNGTLTLSGTTGLSFSFSDGNGTGAGDGTADATMTFRGTIADINTALNGLTYSPNLDSSTADTLSITTNDLGNTGSGGPLTDSDTVTITITAQNDPPVNTVPGTQTFNEDTPLTFSTGNGNAVSVADIDLGGGNIQVSLSTTAGTLTLSGTTGLSFSFSDANGTGSGDGTADASMTFRGTLTDVNNALQGLVFTPTPDTSGPQTISMTSNDLGNTGAGGAQTDSDTINLSITAVNDAPVITRPATIVGNEDVPFTFTGGNVISVADDSTGLVQVSLAVSNGTLTLSGTTGLSFSFSDANGTGTGDGTADASMTFRGTLTDVNNALNNMTYLGGPNFSGADTLNIGANDLGNTGTGGALTDSESTGITVNAVNDPPQNNVPGLQTFNEDTTLTFSTGNGNAVSVSDVDLGGGNIQVALSTTAGTLTLSGTTGLSFSFSDANGTGSGDGTADASMTFRGLLADVNNALQGMTFTPTLNLSGPQTISMTSNDLGNTGAGGAQSDSDTINLSITAVNDAPVNTVPGGQTINQDSAFIFSGANQISVADVDLGGGNIQITLTATNGVVSLSGTTGLSFSFSDANGTGAGDGTTDPTMTFRGTLTDVNNALNGLTFNPTPGFFSGPNASVAIVSNDLGNTGTGGAQTDSDTVNIFVQQVNQAPVNSVPGTQTINEDATLTFSSGNSNLISISDPDAGAATVQVSLSVTVGTLTLSGTSGLSFVFSDGNGTGTGDGTADATMVFRGTIANINAALAGMTFSGGTDVSGSSTLQIITNDLGNTGPGGPQTDTDTVTINITAVNDAPVLTTPASVNATEDVQTGSIAISVTDADSGAGTNFQATLSVSNGVINVTAGGATVGGNNTNSVTITGTVAQVNAALGTAKYTGNLDFNGMDTMVVNVTDNGQTGTGPVGTDGPDNITINVAAVNDAPVNTVPGTQTFNEDTTLTFSNGNGNAISVADVDVGGGNITVTLTTTAGTMAFGSVAGLSSVTNNAASITGTGTLANINNALQGLVFTPTLNINGPQTISFTSSDNGNTGTGGTLTDNDTINLSITAVNDAPTLTTPPSVNATEDVAFTFNGGNTISVADVDVGASNIQVSLTASNGTMSLSGTAGLSFAFSDANGTGAGDGTADAAMTFRGTLAAVNAALNGMTFTGASNFNGTASMSVSANDLGNTGSGGALTAGPNAITINVAAVNDKPLPLAKVFNAQAHMKIVGLSGLLTGVTDPDNGTGPGPCVSTTFTVNTITPITGGTVSNVNASAGSFDFSPAQGFTGVAQLTYTVDDTGCPGVATSDPQTIDINVAGPAIYFVKSVAAGTNDCTLGNECTLATAIPLATAAANRHIFISDANTHTPGVAITLNTGGHLMGQGVTPPVDGDGVLTNDFDDLFDISPPAGTIARPAINAPRPTVMNSAITLNVNSQLRGLNLNIQSGTAVTSTGRTGLKITDMNIQSNTNVAGTFALDLGTSSGDFTIGTVSINAGRNGSAVRFATTTSTNTVTIGNISTEGGQGFSGSSTGSTNFSFTNVTSTTGAAVTTNTSSGNFTFNNITSTTGAALSVTSSGAGDFTAANVTSTTGTAVGVTTATGDFTFTQINANGAVKGISVNSLTGAGTFKVNGTGTTDGSGGIVQNCTQRGAEFLTANNITLKNMNFNNNGTAGTGGDDANCRVSGFNTNTNCHAGIHINTSTTVDLNNLDVVDGNQMGINGIGITGLTMTNLSVQRNGDETYEGGVTLINLAGTVSVTNSIFKDNFFRQFEMSNHGAQSPTITFSGNTVSMTTFSTTQEQGAYFANEVGSSGTLTATLTNNVFDRIFSYAVRFDGAGGSMVPKVGQAGVGNGNTFTNVGLAVGISGGMSGSNNFEVRNNTVTSDETVTLNTHTTPFSFTRAPGATGNWTGTVDSNTIGATTNNAADKYSGCRIAGCTGIEVTDNGADAAHVYHINITNNQVRHVTGHGVGIFATGVIGQGQMTAVLTGNTIQYPENAVAGDASASGNGFHIVNGDDVNDTYQMCIEISGNTVDGNWGNAAATGVVNGDSIRLRQRTENATGTFRIRNYDTTFDYDGGGPGTETDALRFIENNNTITNFIDKTGFQRSGTAPNFTGGTAACP